MRPTILSLCPFFKSICWNGSLMNEDAKLSVLEVYWEEACVCSSESAIFTTTPVGLPGSIVMPVWTKFDSLVGSILRVAALTPIEPSNDPSIAQFRGATKLELPARACRWQNPEKSKHLWSFLKLFHSIRYSSPLRTDAHPLSPGVQKNWTRVSPLFVDSREACSSLNISGIDL